MADQPTMEQQQQQPDVNVAGQQAGSAFDTTTPSAAPNADALKQEASAAPSQTAELAGSTKYLEPQDNHADIASVTAASMEPVQPALSNGTSGSSNALAEGVTKDVGSNGPSGSLNGDALRDAKSSMNGDVASSSSDVGIKEPIADIAPPIVSDRASSTSQGVSGPSASAAAAEVLAPGTGNPYDAQEEADVGASGPASDAHPSSVGAQRPSELAVDPAKESLPLPVDVNGTMVDGQSEDRPQAVTASSDAITAETDRPTTAVHLNGAATSSASAVDSTPIKDTTMTDVSGSGSDPSSGAPIVAPALGGLGVGTASAEPPAAQSIESNEPPAKRQRTETLPEAAGTPAAPVTPTGPLPDASTIAMTPAQIKFAQNSIKSLKNRPESPAFQAPVNPVALGIPHYTQIITQPMDLGTIDIKLALTAAALKGGKPTEKTKQAAAWGLDQAKDIYVSVEQWEGDVRLVFANCVRFNGPDHPVSASAKALEAVFERHMKTLPVEVPPPAPEPVVDDKKARRPSNPVPTIRRLSSDLSGRPKREIHPPPPRDLPYADEPQSSSGGKKRKSGKPLTAREQQYYAKVNQDELKYCLKVIDEFLTKASNQHFMWVFNDLPAKDMDFAPAYYQLIKRPICLNQIQGRLRKREYTDKSDFVADMKLLFNNCYTFNPPDNEVHQMGKRTEAVFEEKMSNMPKAKPLSPEPDVEDEEEEEDAEAEAAKLAQIRELEEKLAEMKREAKLGGAKASGSGGKAGGPKKKASSGAVGEGKKKGPSKPKASSAGGASLDGQPKKPKQSKKKAASGSKGGAGSDEEEDVRVVTYEQKEELARKITQLSEERLDGALQIISEDKPASANDDEEIELDIDDLSPRTLYRLYRYVVKPKKKPGPKPGTAKAGSGKGVGGKKRKNLDEEAEAARIAALQEQLNSFERANNGVGAGSVPAAAAAAPVAGGHDDLVQSESSSGEEDSDGSESDY